MGDVHLIVDHPDLEDLPMSPGTFQLITKEFVDEFIAGK